MHKLSLVKKAEVELIEVEAETTIEDEDSHPLDDHMASSIIYILIIKLLKGNTIKDNGNNILIRTTTIRHLKNVKEPIPLLSNATTCMIIPIKKNKLLKLLLP